ncbi:MAG: bifunctional adenosylcobinamide kinase/adenosylcobinamide-phosphate guanylyltransferase [Dehalococcoidia bacterium]|nr:bifunctional adenosylcobinamide kinase/adenosylcobinamide-phosphate guanylyltransferase [Dehalococcoidia bacterium]
MTKELILILGGARSGKSALAERLARQRERVLFVATAEALDMDMERRIAAHRSQRPSAWSTLEEPLDLSSAIQEVADGYEICLLDCLTLWVSNLLLKMEDDPNVEREVLAEVKRLLEVYEESSATWIVVSNEVGLGIVPPTPLGRQYRDILGRANQAVAARADRVYLTVAGLMMDLKSIAVPISGGSI